MDLPRINAAARNADRSRHRFETTGDVKTFQRTVFQERYSPQTSFPDFSYGRTYDFFHLRSFSFPSNSSSLFRLFLSLSFFLSAILALISVLDVGGGTQTSDLSLSVPTNSPVHVYFTLNAWFRWPPQPFIPFSCGRRLNATYFRSMRQRSSRAPIIIGF